MYKKLFFACFMFSRVQPVMAISTYELERIVSSQHQLLNGYQQRIAGLQNEVDVLRGQLQETTYKLEETIARQKMILSQLNDKKSHHLIANKNHTSEPNGALKAWEPSDNEKADYNYLVEKVLKGNDTVSTIAAFQQFTKYYPASPYLANALYWLGQLNFQQSKNTDASYYFANVVKKFPTSAKAPESMYKLGLILQKEGKQDKAKMIFEQVISKFPKNINIINKAKKQLSEKAFS